MKFDPDIIEGVKARALNGVEFEDAEVIKALEKVSDSLSLYDGGSFGSLVERAAGCELRERNPLPEPPPTFWQRLWGTR